MPSPVRATRAGLTSATSVVMVLVLLGLGGLLGWSVLALSSTASDVAEERGRLAAYAALQRAVASEAFAEAAYRRASAPEAREELDRAVEDVRTAIARTRKVGDRSDGALLSYLQTLNDRYAREVRTTLDTTDDRSADDRVAGPALDAIQRLLDGAIFGHRAEADAAAARQRTVLRAVTVALPVVFVIALGAVLVAWWHLRQEHRRLTRRAADSERRAQTDALTGLANREALTLVLDSHLEGERVDACCLLMLDLDRFKPVNDRLGHAAGDAVLTETARRMQRAVRDADLVARIGGDEFAVLLVDCRDPGRVAEKLLAALTAPVSVEGVEVAVGASIGVARAPGDATETSALMRAADVALYRAKTAGRGRVHVADERAPQSPVTALESVPR